MKKDPTLFSIGEIEKMSGLKAQTIRRYDAKGILLGRRDDANGYRYYDSIELCVAIWIRYLRSYDMSLKDVDDFLKSDIWEQIEIAALQRDRLEREHLRIRCKLACLNEMRQALEGFAVDPDACTLCKRPEMLGFFYRDHDALIKKGDYIVRMEEWGRCTPMVQPMFRIGHDMIFAQGHPETEYKIGLWMKKSHHMLFELPMDENCFIAPEQTCIHTVFEGYDAISRHPAYLEKVRRRVEKFADEKGIVPTGPIYGNSFYSMRTRQGLHHLAHLWIPIEQK